MDRDMYPYEAKPIVWLWMTDSLLESACISYLLSRLLIAAGNCSRDCRRSKIVPLDIRLVFNDAEGQRLFKYSKVFWKGADQVSLVAEGSHTVSSAEAS
jgi:hypothetical protein